MRAHVEARLESLRVERTSWWAHWADLARFILPRRYRWLIQQNQWNRGAEINQSIIDETGTLASRTLASGMMAGITSPARPWFDLTIPQLDIAEDSPVKVWLDKVSKRLADVLAGSNYYTSKAVQFGDIGVFGTAPMVIYEDPEEVIRCFTACAGEFFIFNDERGAPGGLYREFVRTAPQVVAEFGEENCSEDCCQAYARGGAAMQQEFIVCHAIEKNDRKVGSGIVPSIFPWREVYWEKSTAPNKKLLRAKGFHEQPFSAPRWDLVGNDPYGRSPGMDALPAIKQLQQEQRRKAEVIDKGARPPMIADVQMKNEPMSQIPGGVTYVTNAAGVGFKPALEVDPRFVQFIAEDIKEVQERINRIFFADLFLMISQLDTVRTATEIDARKEEKLIQLGPVLERFQNESLDPEIERVFAIMVRRSMPMWARGQDGLLPLPPPEVAQNGAQVAVEYVSMLSVAQRAASTAAIERLAGFVGNLAAADPQALDTVDFDEMVEEYATALGVSAQIIRSTVQVAQIRQQRNQQQQQQMMMQNSLAAAQGAQTLSKVDVGGGQNAIQAMLGTGGGQQAA